MYLMSALLVWRGKSLQSCPTLCDPMGHSPPGSSVHGILQAGILGWVAIPGDLPDPGIELASPGAPALQTDSLPLSHRGSLLMAEVKRSASGSVVSHSL